MSLARPTFNPYYPLDKQTNYSVYPPHKITTKSYESGSLKIDHNGYYKPIKKQAQYFRTTHPNYGCRQYKQTYFEGINIPDRTNYAQITSALGQWYPTNFSQTTDAFVDRMIKMNRKNINDYHNIVHDNYFEVIDNIKNL